MTLFNSTQSRGEAEYVMQQMSLEQKVQLLAGQTTWRTAAIPEHNIPGLKCTDGPNGARGESIHNSTKAVCFPCGSCLGATWDRDLVEAVGREIGREAKTKRAQILLGPTMNIHRHPLHGRNFESFSEDPVLTGHLAASYITGVQSQNIAATPKHFVANEVEKNRTSVDTLVAQSTLREIYLKAFQIMLQNCDPMCLMTSYNKVNGEWCSQDKDLLQSLVREEWRYQGMIMSDWFGTYSTVAPIKAGMNLEMPGPTKHRGQKTLDAIANEELSEVDIEKCALPVLELAIKMRNHLGAGGDEVCDVDPRSVEVARKAATAGIVLLKNDSDVLPLEAKRMKKVAMIGHFATTPAPHGGGSASVRSSKIVTPFEALKEKLPNSEVLWSYGVPIFKKLPSPPLKQTRISADESSVSGTQLEWFDGREFSADKLLLTESLEEFNMILIDPRIPGLKPDFCIRFTSYITAETTGVHTFALTSAGPSTLYIDDKQFNTFEGLNKISEDFIWQPSKYEKRKKFQMTKGQSYKVVLEAQGTYTAPPPGLTICPQGCRVGFYDNSLAETGIQDACKLASESDVAIIFVGNSTEYESEGFDRETMSLSQEQDDLIRAVAKANKHTIVVNQSGAPVAFPWSTDVGALLQCFYAGQEVGNAIADILLGNVNPSGKLPTSFPLRIEDTAGFENFPGTDVQDGNKISYEEGSLIGYRHFEATDVKPAFPFGHGLSYTTFDVTAEVLDVVETADDTSVKLLVTVSNIGARRGDEVVQIYVRLPNVGKSTTREVKVLKQFAKVHDIEAGRSKSIEVILGKDAFSIWDDATESWRIEPTTYKVFVSNSLEAATKALEVELTKSKQWRGL